MLHESSPLRAVVIAVGLLVCAPTAHAQGRLEGTVRTATGARPIIGAVRLANGRLAPVDSLGHFRFDSLQAGEIVATAHAALFLDDSARVTIQSGRTTHHDFLLPVDSLWIVKHEEKWLGCSGAPSGVQCIPPRGLAAEPWGFRAGAWLFRDSVALSEFWLAHAPRNAAASIRRLSPIDWSREKVVAVSYGSYSGCGPHKYVNRIELRADTIVVLVGPDSLYEGPPIVTCDAVVSSTDFVMVPRPRGAVVVRPANPGSGMQSLEVTEVASTSSRVPATSGTLRTRHTIEGALIGGAVGVVTGLMVDRVGFRSSEGRGSFDHLEGITGPAGATIGALIGFVIPVN